MNETFSSKLKAVREKYFPGMSLRRVAQKLNLGENFYSSLSRIESGEFLPSEEVLRDILNFYPISLSEKDEILSLYTVEKLNKACLIPKNTETMKSAVSFFRKVRTKK